MIEVNVIDGASGEAEIMQSLTAYLADRLFTPRQRKSMQVFVYLTRWMSDKPLTIDKLKWHYRPWEIEACHWQTIIVDEFLTLLGGNQPFQLLQKKGKQHLALFEAALPAQQVVRHNPEPHLAMMDAPATISPSIGADASETADHAATGLFTSSPHGTFRIVDNAASIDPLLTMPMPPVEEASGNQADAHQATAHSAADDTDDHTISAVALKEVFAAVESQADDSPEAMTPVSPHPAAPADRDISQLVGNAARNPNLNGPELIGTELNGIGLYETGLNGSGSNEAQMNGSCLNGNPADGLGTNGHHPDSAIMVSHDVMQIIVPGLESPRPLHPDSLVAKRQDLQQRGLLDG